MGLEIQIAFIRRMNTSQDRTRLDSLVLAQLKKEKNMSRENRMSAVAAQKNGHQGKPMLAMHFWTVSKEKKIKCG